MKKEKQLCRMKAGRWPFNLLSFFISPYIYLIYI